MIKLIDKFYHNGEWVETSQPIEVISAHVCARCKSGIAIRTIFTSLKMQLDVDAGFIFNETEIKLLKDKEKRDYYFEEFLLSAEYGI